MQSRFLLLVVMILWAGLLLGVSFLATPIKFSAPHLTMPIAIEVGAATFDLFNQVEWFVVTLLAMLASVGKKEPQIIGAIFGLGTILLIQTFWLLPVLSARAEIVISGGMVNPSIHHWLYIAADTMKLAVIGVSVWLMRWRDK